MPAHWKHVPLAAGDGQLPATHMGDKLSSWLTTSASPSYSEHPGSEPAIGNFLSQIIVKINFPYKAANIRGYVETAGLGGIPTCWWACVSSKLTLFPPSPLQFWVLKSWATPLSVGANSKPQELVPHQTAIWFKSLLRARVWINNLEHLCEKLVQS